MMIKGRFTEYSIGITEKALCFIEMEAAKTKRIETGGIIAGKGNHEEGKVLITHASGSGPRAVRRRRSFMRDTLYCQGLLDQWAIQSKGEIDYFGEWHKHFEIEPRPSVLDLDTMQRIASDRNYHVEKAILLIIGVSNRRNSLRTFIIGSRGILEANWWERCNIAPYKSRL